MRSCGRVPSGIDYVDSKIQTAKAPLGRSRAGERWSYLEWPTWLANTPKSFFRSAAGPDGSTSVHAPRQALMVLTLQLLGPPPNGIRAHTAACCRVANFQFVPCYRDRTFGFRRSLVRKQAALVTHDERLARLVD